MIYKKCIMTINKNNATLDEDIYLFRLDKNIELHFSIVNNRYKFDKSDLNNIIAQTNAAYFQIRLYRSDEIKYTFAIQPTQDGVAVLTITDDLINDPIELGEYDFQISLLDADKTSMISMPIVKQQLHVCEPLVDNQAIMGKAVLGLTNLASGEIKNAFDSEGNYIREIHKDGDILSAQLINKFEEALDTNTKASKDLATKKYVDDKVTVKILPVDYDKNCATNVADLEPHSIYMSPNDAKFLYLGYEKLGGSFSGFFLSGNPHGKFIYTGAKDDTKIEVILEGICYTAYFKTDTVDAHTEKTVYYLTKNNNKEFTPTTDYEPATKKYVDDNILLEQLPILRVDETNKRIYVNCNNMGTYKKYFVPNKYANVYGFSFIYTNEDKSETEIALIGGAMTRDDFILCARNTDTLFVLILGGTNKYTYTKSTKTLEKGLYGYLKIGNTQEYTPTENYHPATKKYVDDNKIAYTISSKVLTTVSASDIKLDEPITVNNVSINKDRRYYIEFLGIKKLCSLSVDEEEGNAIICGIGNYGIDVCNDLTNISITINKINEDNTTTDTFTDLIIHEEEVKYLDSKYLETDLTLQNSISLGRVGDIGYNSSAIGYKVKASGSFSHAEGQSTISSGSSSHAEGYNATAIGMSSHAEGSSTIASGVNSHAEGDYTTASGASSHAEGYGSKASSQFQHVQGKYNIEDKNRKYAHIVGNGAGDAKRSNAHTLDWKGNGWYAGKLSQEGTPTEDKDLVTKKYVDDKVKDTLVTTNISGTTLALTVNKYQTATVADGTEITLPTVTSFTEIHLFFSTTTDLTLVLPACKWQNGNTPTIAANKTYEFIFTYTTEWLGGVIVYE